MREEEIYAPEVVRTQPPLEESVPAEPAPGVAPPAAAPAADPAPRHLDPRAISLWRVAFAIRTLIYSAIILVAAAFLPLRFPLGWVAAGVALLGAVLTLFWPPRKYRAWRFQLRESDLFVSYGVLWRTTSIFPHARIQHVDTQHGPIERGLGLARLIVYTAGVRGADVVIPGLALAEAEALRDQLAAVGGGEDAV